MVLTAFSIKQLPISVGGASKSDVRTQFAALCWRVNGDRPEILLITSRTTRRWIVPKGWPMDGCTPAECALTEAWEEAGVVGRAGDQPVGLFSYLKDTDDGEFLPCVAVVYPVKVKRLAARFPERAERRRKWFSPRKAATRVQEPELARILRDFDPRGLR